MCIHYTFFEDASKVLGLESSAVHMYQLTRTGPGIVKRIRDVFVTVIIYSRPYRYHSLIFVSPFVRHYVLFLGIYEQKLKVLQSIICYGKGNFSIHKGIYHLEIY